MRYSRECQDDWFRREGLSDHDVEMYFLPASAQGDLPGGAEAEFLVELHVDGVAAFEITSAGFDVRL